MVSDYIEHDELSAESELMLLSDKYVHLAEKYTQKWGFGLRAKEMYERLQTK